MGWVWEYLCCMWMLTTGSMMTQPVGIHQPLSLDIPGLVRWANEWNCISRRMLFRVLMWIYLHIGWLGYQHCWVPNFSTVETPMCHHFLGDQQVLGWQRDYIGHFPSGTGHQFVLMEIITYSGMDLPPPVLLPEPSPLDFLITLYTLCIFEISHTIFLLVKKHISQWKR